MAERYQPVTDVRTYKKFSFTVLNYQTEQCLEVGDSENRCSYRKDSGKWRQF